MVAYAGRDAIAPLIEKMQIPTLRRYLAREIYGAIFFVSAAFLALFAFFDLINELGSIGRGNYRLQHAMGFVLLSLPSHVYELAPIAVKLMLWPMHILVLPEICKGGARLLMVITCFKVSV